ncbi:type II secretion system protein J [Chloroflexota bacterium]
MRQSERGFTLWELSVVIALSAIITLGAGTTAVQMIRGSAESNALMAVSNQVNNVGYWVSRDILTAQSVNASDDSGTGDIEFVVMNWKNWETGEMHDIRYIWLASADSLQKVRRKQVIRDNNDAEISNKATLVADNIYSANLTQEDTRWKLIVEAHSGDRSLNREYFISQRQGQ